jgi:hypothetical protein
MRGMWPHYDAPRERATNYPAEYIMDSYAVRWGPSVLLPTGGADAT